MHDQMAALGCSAGGRVSPAGCICARRQFCGCDDIEGAERPEKWYWHRDSKKCQRVWRPGSPPRPVKRELSQEAPPDAAAVKLEPVGLKLEQVEEKETAVDEREMDVQA